MKIYGYCNTEAQKREILAKYPEAQVTVAPCKCRIDEMTEIMDDVLCIAGKGDTVVFSSVTLLGEDTYEALDSFKALMENEILCVFLREPHLNTKSFLSAMADIPKSENPRTAFEHLISTIFDATSDVVNRAMYSIVKAQLNCAYAEDSKQKVEEAPKPKAEKPTRKIVNAEFGTLSDRFIRKAIRKELIWQFSKNFCGTLNDKEVMKICEYGNDTSYYKLKREMQSALRSSPNA